MLNKYILKDNIYVCEKNLKNLFNEKHHIDVQVIIVNELRNKINKSKSMKESVINCFIYFLVMKIKLYLL